jgi:putative lipoprotein (rSAM/lipoprotein system)
MQQKVKNVLKMNFSKMLFSAQKGLRTAAAILVLALPAASCEDALQVPSITVPTSTYQVRGKVMSKIERVPIHKIRVVFSVDPEAYELPSYVSHVHQEVDESYTDKTGAFFVELETPPADHKVFFIKFIDIDGGPNVAYAERLDTVEFDHPTFAEGRPDENYNGFTEIDLGVVFLDTILVTVRR